MVNLSRQDKYPYGQTGVVITYLMNMAVIIGTVLIHHMRRVHVLTQNIIAAKHII